MNTSVFLCACFSAWILVSINLVYGANSETRLKVFLKLSDGEDARHNKTLSVRGLQHFVDILLGQLECDNDHNQEGAGDHDDQGDHKEGCPSFLCIDATTLVSSTRDADPSEPISEEQFESACIVLLDLITSAARDPDLCHKNADLSTVNLQSATSRLLTSALGVEDGAAEIPTSGLTKLMDILKEHISHAHHDHSGHKNHDDDHSGHKNHDDDHSDNGDNHGHADGHDDHTNEPGDEHTDEHSKAAAAALVVGKKCLSSDSVIYYMGVNKKENIPTSRLSQLAAIVAFMVYDGSGVQEKCRQLPCTEQFMSTTFGSYATQGQMIDVQGLKSLMTKMGINNEASDSEDHHDHEGHHDHRRRRRSVETTMQTDSLALPSLQRWKRQAAVPKELTTCYSAEQLMALYDASTGVDQASFVRLCPALVSQKVFADCSKTHADSSDEDVSDAEKFGYGTLAIAIICISSVFGVIFLPCVSVKVYEALMSTFVGLAVGTLFADAVLHLIPMAMGVHVHGAHDHSSGDIVVEDHIRYGLAIMGGLYAFYLLETVMSRLFGHSDTVEPEEFSQMEVFSNGLKSVSTIDTGLTDEEKSVKSPNGNCANRDAQMMEDLSENSSDGEKRSCNDLSPLALMILLGDAVHNFADGLAVGAAFTNSVTSGVATSIAIFCHELPHELGDFAVLLQSGCSFKKAVCLNFASALTAFMGLYVGILVATKESTQSYIFAVAASMFIYIALVDLLPQMTRTKSRFHLILNNIGILMGYGIMFIIAIFEEHITV